MHVVTQRMGENFEELRTKIREWELQLDAVRSEIAVGAEDTANRIDKQKGETNKIREEAEAMKEQFGSTNP